MVCDWPVTYPGGGKCAPLDGATDEDKARFEAMATEYLWRWTGLRFGTCEISVRPCRVDCGGSTHSSTFWGRGPSPRGVPWSPVLIDGHWKNLTCGDCGARCRCLGGPGSLALPGPVVSVAEVLIDGEALPPASYAVRNSRFLLRTDGGVWPTCQDMTKEPTQPGTFEVTYTYGVPVPEQGQLAAGVLACELAKANANDSTCRLPQRVQTITRQGVTMAMLDPMDDIDKGHTGIWLIDSWVASVSIKPTGGTVRSVDVPTR